MTVRKPSDQNFGNGVFLVPQFSARSSQAGCAMGFSFLRPSASPMHLGEAALPANAYRISHDILGDVTRLSSSWIRRAITRRISTLHFVGDAIGSAGVVAGNTIQVILGAHLFLLVAFWLKRELKFKVTCALAAF